MMRDGPAGLASVGCRPKKLHSQLSSIRRIINFSGASPRGHRHGRSVYSSAVCVANATTLSDRFYTPTNAFRRVGLPQRLVRRTAANHLLTLTHPRPGCRAVNFVGLLLDADLHPPG